MLLAQTLLNFFKYLRNLPDVDGSLDLSFSTDQTKLQAFYLFCCFFQLHRLAIDQQSYFIVTQKFLFLLRFTSTSIAYWFAMKNPSNSLTDCNRLFLRVAG